MSLKRLLTLGSVLSMLSGCASSTPAAACPPSPAAATSTDEDLNKLSQEQLATKLITVTMGKDLGEQVLHSMTESMRQMPGLPAGFIDRFQANANAEDLQTLVIPIYVKMYDRKTMIAAITFYESEQGRILVSKLPEVTRLGTEAGQRWGKQLAEKTLREMGLTPPAN